ncbi:MAG: hypothetical protein B7X65_14860 [Polaromonas sp. 39-63-25]|nr:MAG: hypothetical protein B7Y09_15720 [Polaromonas sp. 24-63-21]OZA87102.1 MAG: hypothetical protein B7X65_14860 [Polaromonas sp. 39-63-25]
MHRVVQLNARTPRLIDPYAKQRSRYSARQKSLITNNSVIDLGKLAHAMGEPISNFRLATLEALAPWTYHLFHTATVRFCRQCLGLGYHSTLMSMRAVERCPIHGCEIDDKCPCGRAISACVRSELFQIPGQCDCGKLGFFTRETARRPLLEPGETKAFDELAQWLEQTSDRVIMMSVKDKWETFQGEGSLECSAQQWSDLTKIRLPSAFMPPAAVQSLIAEFEARGGPFPRSSGEVFQRMKEIISLRHQFFKSFDRHIRRHVLKGQYWINRISMSSDSDVILSFLQRYPDARSAFTYLIWLAAVWGSHDLRQVRTTVASNGYMRGASLPGLPRYNHKNAFGNAACEWLEMHAAGLALSSMWMEAHERMLGMVAQQSVSWGWDTSVMAGKYRWCATVEQDGCWKIGKRARPCTYLPVRHREDSARAPSTRPQAPQAREFLEKLARVGLIKTCRNEWKSGKLRLPSPHSGLALKLHRMFGVKDRLSYVVFPRYGKLFIARLVERPIEAHGLTSRSAVNSLRAAVIQHQGMYGSSSPANPGATSRDTGLH